VIKVKESYIQYVKAAGYRSCRFFVGEEGWGGAKADLKLQGILKLKRIM
jgi:hypothetical protein